MVRKSTPRPRPPRAQSPEDKAQRRHELVAVAARLLERERYAAITMAQVAEAAGVAKGTVFLSFASKEALFLAVLEAQLADWLTEVAAALDEGGRWTPARVARVFATTLSPRKPFIDLLALLSSVLEQNVDVETIAAFKLQLLTQLAAAGTALERRLPLLRPGEGAQVFLHLDAIVVGVHLLTRPSAAAQQALKRPALRALDVDFTTELTVVLQSYLVGRAQGPMSRTPRTENP